MSARGSMLVVALAAALALGVAPAAQQGDRGDVDRSAPPAEWRIPEAPVRSPEESIALMEAAPGFRVELVAAEPLVQDPVAFAFDPEGRLWVLEWPAYNWEVRAGLPDVPLQDPPRSRVVVLKDEDGDGGMDRRTVFAEIDWPRGLQPIAGGVLVFALPEVVFLRDTDGDGRADSREVIESGLPIPANPHSAPSSPAWNLDNWIYSLQTGTRVRHAGGRWEREPSGRMAGQWGLTHDDYGRLFFGYNGDHLRGSLVPPQYAVRNPAFTASAGVDVRIAHDQEVWPAGVTASVNRRAQLRDDGRLRVFTANAGPSVYRGTQFPAEFHGNVFLAEGAGRLIRRAVLTEEGGLLTARNAYEGGEFLFSRDERFRPVFTASGPDGALYVADMYRGLFEGHLFVTTFLRRQVIERALHQPFHGMGRIYRVRYEGRKPDAPPASSPATTADWLPLLFHPNGFWRDAAQRALVSAGDRSVAATLRSHALSAEDARVRLHALWTLEGLGQVDDELVLVSLRDRSRHVRAAALRLAEPRLGATRVLEAALRLSEDLELSVRRQLVYSLGASDSPHALEAVLAILERDGGEAFIVHAALSGFAGEEEQVLQRLAGAAAWREERPGAKDLFAALATAITNYGTPDGVERLLRFATAEAQPAWRAQAILEGMAAATRSRLDPVPPSLVLLRDIERPELRERAAAVWKKFGDPPAAPSVEVSALAEGGRVAYTVCGACHQADGRGLPALAPSLHGTSRVIGPPDALIDIVLHGRDEDPAFPSMPPLAGLSDEQVAAILTYIRQAWGNAAPPVTPEQVRGRR